jgi:alpha-tubulin suppressor-like RCC1 family protein
VGVSYFISYLCISDNILFSPTLLNTTLLGGRAIIDITAGSNEASVTGGGFALVLTSDGGVYGYSRNNKYAQVGDGTILNRDYFVTSTSVTAKLFNGEQVTKLVAGRNGMAVTSHSRVLMWGDNTVRFSIVT